MFYPYRTTAEKMVQAQEGIAASGDTVVSVHHVVGRDWVILCRRGRDEVSRPELARIWQAIEVLAASGVSVGPNTETGQGATIAHGASGVLALHEVLDGVRSGAQADDRAGGRS